LAGEAFGEPGEGGAVDDVEFVAAAAASTVVVVMMMMMVAKSGCGRSRCRAGR
jgi:hypothetical protein